jgi:hypothetical protein
MGCISQLKFLILADQLPYVNDDFFVSVTRHIQALDSAQLNNSGSSLGPLPHEYVVSEFEVSKELSKLKLRKSVGPESIALSILKNLADPLAASVVINYASLRQCIVPELRKISL